MKMHVKYVIKDILIILNELLVQILLNIFFFFLSQLNNDFILTLSFIFYFNHSKYVKLVLNILRKTCFITT